MPRPRASGLGPSGPGPSRGDAARRWSQLHHGIDPAGVPLLGTWLRVVWWLARPAVRLRVPPTVVTVLGVSFAAGAVALARSLPWGAAGLVLIAALCDALDGAIAVLADAATRRGAIADALADRLVDVAFAIVLSRCGAPWWLAALAAVVAVGVDVLRRVVGQPTVITVAERPSWTICAVLACVSSAASDARWPVLVCAAVWIALGVAGVAQLAVLARASRPSCSS